MKRRDALKNIGLSAGLIIATPSIISLLNSCNTNPNNWRPIFLNKEQSKVLIDIVDIIIYGVKIKNCYDFCRFVNLNYNNADYIDIVTIVRTLDCIINETCISNNVCNPQEVEDERIKFK